jgi:hypothetical protein
MMGRIWIGWNGHPDTVQSGIGRRTAMGLFTGMTEAEIACGSTGK